MKCMHCTVSIFPETSFYSIGDDKDPDGYFWTVRRDVCPSCGQFNLYLIKHHFFGSHELASPSEFIPINPKGTTRPPCPKEVPKEIKDAYLEACLVINDSPKASAALSRRCLQHLLIDAEKVDKDKNLYNQIQDVIDKGKIPTELSKSLHIVRVIGNFAAHPEKSQSTGLIVDVEKGEAGWNLETLEGLFDYYYVQPTINQKKLDAINKKMIDTGHKPIK